MAKNPGSGIRTALVLDTLQQEGETDKACNSLTLLAEAKASRKAVLNESILSETSINGSNGEFDKNVKTQDKFHLGARDKTLGLSLSKVFIKSDKYLLVPTLQMPTCSKVSEIADL